MVQQLKIWNSGHLGTGLTSLSACCALFIAHPVAAQGAAETGAQSQAQPAGQQAQAVQAAPAQPPAQAAPAQPPVQAAPAPAPAQPPAQAAPAPAPAPAQPPAQAAPAPAPAQPPAQVAPAPAPAPAQPPAQAAPAQPPVQTPPAQPPVQAAPVQPPAQAPAQVPAQPPVQAPAGQAPVQAPTGQAPAAAAAAAPSTALSAPGAPLQPLAGQEQGPAPAQNNAAAPAVVPAPPAKTKLATAPKASPAPEEKRRKDPRIEVAIGSGLSYGWSNHPNFNAYEYNATPLQMEVSLLLNHKVAIGFSLAQNEVAVDYDGPNLYRPRGQIRIPEGATEFRVADANASQQSSAGRIVAGSYVTRVVGPSLDISPWGRSGMFASVVAGVGTIDLAETRRGLGLLSRLGYRISLARRISIGGGVGVQAVATDNVKVFQPLLFAEGRAHLF